MNWKTVIAAIKRERDMTQPQIAAAVGCSQVTISDLATGRTSEPRHALGQALLQLLHSKADSDGKMLDASINRPLPAINSEAQGATHG